MIIAGIEFPDELMLRPFWKRLWLFDFYQTEKSAFMRKHYDPKQEGSQITQMVTILKHWDRLNGFDDDDEWTNLYYCRSTLKKLGETSSTIEEMIDEIEAIRLEDCMKSRNKIK